MINSSDDKPSNVFLYQGNNLFINAKNSEPINREELLQNIQSVTAELKSPLGLIIVLIYATFALVLVYAGVFLFFASINELWQGVRQNSIDLSTIVIDIVGIILSFIPIYYALLQFHSLFMLQKFIYSFDAINKVYQDMIRQREIRSAIVTHIIEGEKTTIDFQYVFKNQQFKRSYITSQNVTLGRGDRVLILHHQVASSIL